jgi:hypothetical protein
VTLVGGVAMGGLILSTGLPFANAQASTLTKSAVDAAGNPITGPVRAGDTIKYVVSYKGAGPVTITDTPSAPLAYVGASLQMPPGWTKNPATEFGGAGGNTPTAFTGSSVNLASVTAPLSSGATGAPSSGGDGWTPIVVGSKVYGINHGSPNQKPTAFAKVDCWDKATLASCVPLSSIALRDGSGNLLHTSGFVDAVVRGSKIYYPAARRNANLSELGVACFETTAFNTAAQFCGFTVWQSAPALGATGFPTIAPGAAARSFVYQSGLFEQPSSDNLWGLMANGAPVGAGASWQNLTLMCRTIAGAPCAGVTDQDLGRWNNSASLSYDIQLSFDPKSNRIWAMLDKTHLTCRQLANPAVTCPGFNSTNGSANPMVVVKQTNFFATPTGVCVSSAGDNSFACYKVDGSIDASMATLVKASTFTNIIGVVYPAGNNWYFPMGTFNGSAWTSDGTVCVDATTLAGCAGFGTGGRRVNPGNPLNYGYTADPADPTCMYSLGDAGYPLKFSAATGANGCAAGSSVTVEPALNYCDNKAHSITWDKATFSPATTGFTQIKVKNSATNAVVATIAVTSALSYDLSSIGYGTNPKLTFEFVNSGSGSGSPTVNVSWKADVDAQVCMSFTVGACPPGGTTSVLNRAESRGGAAQSTANATSDLKCGAAGESTTTTKVDATTTKVGAATTTSGAPSTTIGRATTTVATVAPTLPDPPADVTVPPTFQPPVPTSPVKTDRPDLPYVEVSGKDLPFTG